MPDQDRISQLFADCIAGSLSEEDGRLLEQLLSTDEGIRKKWMEYAKAFESGSSRRFLEGIDTDQAWSLVSQRIVARRKGALPWRNRWMVAAIAAVLLAVFSFGFGNYFFSTPETSDAGKMNGNSDVVLELWSGERHNLVDTAQGTALIRKASASSQRPGAFNTISVPATREYHFMLPDGSEVWLNSSSKLQIPASFQTSSRDVFLKGEAYFKIANHAKFPFTVHADSLDICVLGTEFNVNNFEGVQIVTSLFSGAVETRIGGDRIQLSPGYEAIATKEGLLSREFDPTTTATWRSGIYHFENEPLERLLPVLERWYGKRTRITDPTLSATKLSGAIRKTDSITVFLENLKTTADIEYRFSGDTLLLSYTLPK